MTVGELGREFDNEMDRVIRDDDRIYETKEGRLVAIRHIIVRYLQKRKGIEMGITDKIPMTLDEIIEMVDTDKELLGFSVSNYNAIMSKVKGVIAISKVTREMYDEVKEFLDNKK